ncbi:hypothetical protein AK830_g7696 [Neonectria ditissima]|uniref:Copper-fist domain-containing protein n=1 Tax=Neonectria ditissima TaxID=78410 RepID=A0A0P7B9I2_9HYPO|nr:hypothetical protein AK830_g7696 [Neonectria ditissima]
MQMRVDVSHRRVEAIWTSGEACICAHKNPQSGADKASRTKSNGNPPTPSTTSSHADSGHASTDIIQDLPQTNPVENTGATCHTTESEPTNVASCCATLDNWPFDSLNDTSTASFGGQFTDFATLATQDWMDPILGTSTNESAPAVIPPFNDPLSTIDSSSLMALLGKPSQAELFHIDSDEFAIPDDWNLLDYTQSSNPDAGFYQP